MALFENWTPEHANPQITEAENDKTIILVYFTPWAYVWIGKPEVNSLYPGDLPGYNDLLLKLMTIRNDQGGQRARIVLTYKSPQRGSGSQPEEVKSGATVYTMQDGALEKAISSNPNYRTIWDHHLMNKIGTTQTAPDILTATNTDIAAPAGGTTVDWAWVKDMSEKTDTWEVKTANKKQKQGEESYLVSAPVVNEKTYYKKQSGANNTASKNSTISTPGNTFGKTGSWLVISSSVYFEDPYWVADLAYQSGIVDTDIYDPPS